MEKSTRSSLCPSILLATILGAGALALWIFFWGIISSFVSQWFGSHESEYAFVNRDGDVVIEQYHPSAEDTSYRTVDGQTLTDRKKIRSASGSGLPLPHPELHFTQPLPWTQRIKAISDAQNPQTYWYLITNGLPEGRAYFVGYDHRSKQLVGYIRKSGFSAEIPSPSEQFDFPSSQLQFSFATYYYSPLGHKPNNYSSGDEVAYVVHAISAGKLYRIDLNRRSVEPVELPSEVISISIASMPVESSSNEEQYIHRIAARTHDKVYLLTYDGKIIRSVPIPSNLQSADIELHNTLNSEAILSVPHHFPRLSAEFFWIDDAGQVTRNVDVPLLSQPPPNPKVTAWQKAALVPAALCYAVVLLVILPITDVFENFSPNYSTALEHWWAAGWPALLAVCVLSGVLAVICFRRHKRISEYGSFSWALFVLLFGAPGLIGYLLHRRWPVTEKCQLCGHVSPRDRDACLDCGTEFPASAMKGIEVFA